MMGNGFLNGFRSKPFAAHCLNDEKTGEKSEGFDTIRKQVGEMLSQLETIDL
jgi:hypothetical protein